MTTTELIADLDREVERVDTNQEFLTLKFTPLPKEIGKGVVLSINGNMSEFETMGDAVRWASAFLLKLGQKM